MGVIKFFVAEMGGGEEEVAVLSMPTFCEFGTSLPKQNASP